MFRRAALSTSFSGAGADLLERRGCLREIQEQDHFREVTQMVKSHIVMSRENGKHRVGGREVVHSGMGLNYNCTQCRLSDTKRGYIVLRFFDVRYCPRCGSVNADHWGKFKAFLFENFAVMFWRGKVTVLGVK